MMSMGLNGLFPNCGWAKIFINSQEISLIFFLYSLYLEESFVGNDCLMSGTDEHH